MAANEIDLCLSADVAEDLGIADSAAVQRRVTAASRAIATFLGRTLERSAAITEYPASYRRRYLLLDRTPIVSITSIEIAGTALAATEYECIGANAEAGMVYRKAAEWPRTAQDVGRITPAWDVYQGEASDTGVEVTYAGGYVTPGQNSLDGATYPTVTLPEDIQEAARIVAASLYRNRGADAMIQSESIGSYSVSYFAEKANAATVIPPTAQALLAPYKRHPVI